MGRPFDHVLRLPGAQIEDLALAIAAEFAAVDPAAAHERLDHLALDLGPTARLPARERAERLLVELAGPLGFECDLRGGPATLMLDRVLERRRGHPLALAVIGAAVARRAGFELLTVAGGRTPLLADGSVSPAILFDPAGRMRRPPKTIGWLCPHVVGATMLEAIATRYLERSRIDEAIRALELARALPLAGPGRARLLGRLTALRARLN